MAKTINYPSQDWLDKWVDKWLEDNPDTKVDDFQQLYQKAETAWWYNEIDHDRPTPNDLTPEQEKISQEMRKGMARSENRKTPVKRERKPNDTKREIIETLADSITKLADSITIQNVERQIDFELNGTKYSITLIAHRPPKK